MNGRDALDALDALLELDALTIAQHARAKRLVEAGADIESALERTPLVDRLEFLRAARRVDEQRGAPQGAPPLSPPHSPPLPPAPSPAPSAVDAAPETPKRFWPPPAEDAFLAAVAAGIPELSLEDDQGVLFVGQFNEWMAPWANSASGVWFESGPDGAERGAFGPGGLLMARESPGERPVGRCAQHLRVAARIDPSRRGGARSAVRLRTSAGEVLALLDSSRGEDGRDLLVAYFRRGG